jgi:2-hydroxychromene-2-carboxylate isomerase
VNLVDELHAITAALEGDGIPYAVCGGVAVTIHGATRTTKDIDLLVRRADVPRILELLRGLGYLFAALPMTFDAGTARERHVQRVTKIEGDHHLVVDLMLDEAALAGFLADQIDVELPEGRLRVVSRAGLLAMKRMAARPQDDADIERLEAGDGD